MTEKRFIKPGKMIVYDKKILVVQKARVENVDAVDANGVLYSRINHADWLYQKYEDLIDCLKEQEEQVDENNFSRL